MKGKEQHLYLGYTQAEQMKGKIKTVEIDWKV